MNKSLIIFCLVAGLTSAASAAFEPLFRINYIKGECRVQLPGSSAFVPAEDNRAYPYGTIVVSGPGASFSIFFSEYNECQVEENTRLAVLEESKNSPDKRLRFFSGKATLKLEEDFNEENSVVVETPAANCVALGGSFTISVRSGGEMQITAIAVMRGGRISIDGPHYSIPELGQDDTLTVANSEDKTFVRIKVAKGGFGLQFRDKDGEMRSTELVEGSTIKIWRRRSATGQTVVVTILITAPSGDVEETITYTETIRRPDDSELPEFDLPADQMEVRKKPIEEAPKNWWERLKEKLGADDDVEEENWENFPPIPTTTTTTTTTIPSPTPVGRR